jgi:hypothetical protein
MMRIDVRLSLPLVNAVSGTWQVTDRERSAAWETYVEIITRISPPQKDSVPRDLVRELASLEQLLEKMREVLKKYGPSVGQVSAPCDLSFAYLALTVINVALRPVITLGLKTRDDPSSAYELGRELERVYAVLIDYCNILARAADVVL